MTGHRRVWFASSIALLCAGLAGATATYLWWLPCRGQMLVGTPLAPPFQDDQLTSACASRMNEGTPFPLPSPAALGTPWLLALSTATSLLVGVAWLLPALTLPRVAPAVFAMPGIGVVAIAALGVGTAYGLDFPFLLFFVSVGLDLVIMLFVVVAIARLIAGPRPRWLARFLVVGLAVSSVGTVGMIVEYTVMANWSAASWDSPPGSGYLISAELLLCGIAVLVMTVVSSVRARTVARQQPVDPEAVSSPQ